MAASCWRFSPMVRVISFAAVLVIDVFPVAGSADHSNLPLDIKQDAVIAHPQPLRGLGLMSPCKPEVAGVDRARSGCRPFRAGRVFDGQVPRALPWDNVPTKPCPP